MRKFTFTCTAVAVLLSLGAGPVLAHHDEHGRFNHVSHRAFVAPFGRTVGVCAGQFIPEGWALADTQTNATACGGGTFNNVWMLMDLRGAPHGQTATVCQGFIPDGWVVTGVFTDSTRCGGNLAGVFNNVMMVSKL